MKHYKLRPPQIAAVGFTDLFVLTHADLTETTDNTDQAITLDQVEFGDYIAYDALIEIKTAFDAASADEGLNITLGVNGALTQFIGNSALVSSGTGTAAKTAYAPAAGGAPYIVPTGGKNIQANFDITDADGDLEDHSAGEVWIWMNIRRLIERDISA